MQISKEIEIIKSTRKFILSYIADLSIEQLNKIPEGFKNNIIWNIGHLIASQQGLCYLRSGNKMMVDEKYFQNYKPETKPEAVVEEAAVIEMKEIFISAIEQFETDYANNLFANYNEFTNRYGVTLSTISDAIKFVTFHEGLHIGYIMALKKVVQAQNK